MPKAQKVETMAARQDPGATPEGGSFSVEVIRAIRDLLNAIESAERGNKKVALEYIGEAERRLQNVHGDDGGGPHTGPYPGPQP
jgi:hypothetical protein